MKAFFVACAVVAMFVCVGDVEQNHQHQRNAKVEQISADTAVMHEKCMEGLPSCDMSKW